jgi:hypothetical protein
MNLIAHSEVVDEFNVAESQIAPLSDEQLSFVGGGTPVVNAL